MYKEMIQLFVTNLVNDKESVKVTEEETNGKIMIRIVVSNDEVGRVIGKNGKIILALRELVKSIGKRDNKNISLDVKGNSEKKDNNE